MRRLSSSDSSGDNVGLIDHKVDYIELPTLSIYSQVNWGIFLVEFITACTKIWIQNHPYLVNNPVSSCME